MRLRHFETMNKARLSRNQNCRTVVPEAPWRHEACLMNVENDSLDVVGPGPERADGMAKLIDYPTPAVRRHASGPTISLSMASGPLRSALDRKSSRNWRLVATRSRRGFPGSGVNRSGSRSVVKRSIISRWVTPFRSSSLVDPDAIDRLVPPRRDPVAHRLYIWGDSFEPPVFGLTVIAIVSFGSPIISSRSHA